MNYLAHIFLSGGDARVQLGNFFADAVKGRSYRDYPPAMAEGIMLHRAIDRYTDNHPAVKGAVRLLKPHFGRYSAVLLDIYFDYLLASRFDEFSDVPLRRFARRFYRVLIVNRRWLPGRFRRFMWHFVLTGRLGKYGTVEGVRQSLGIMADIGRLKVPTDEAVAYLVANEDGLWEVFAPFFRELQALCEGFVVAENRDLYLARFF